MLKITSDDLNDFQRLKSGRKKTKLQKVVIGITFFKISRLVLVLEQSDRTKGGAGGRCDDGVPTDQLQLSGEGEQVLLRSRQRIPTSQQSMSNGSSC